MFFFVEHVVFCCFFPATTATFDAAEGCFSVAEVGLRTDHSGATGGNGQSGMGGVLHLSYICHVILLDVFFLVIC